MSELGKSYTGILVLGYYYSETYEWRCLALCSATIYQKPNRQLPGNLERGLKKEVFCGPPSQVIEANLPLRRFFRRTNILKS